MEHSHAFVKPQRVCPPSDRKYNKLSCCLKPIKPPKTPDPGQYSQFERFQNGQSLSWDNPDITTNRGNSNEVDDDVLVKVRNYSANAPAIGVYVKVAYSQFGIGFPRQTLNILQTNLNKQGLNGAEVQLTFPLPRQVRDEWANISTFIDIEHPHDPKTLNNKGEQCWSAGRGQAGSPYEFQFPIHNNLGFAETFSLRVLEADWAPALSTNSINLIPGQSANITLTINPPAGADDRKAFNVAALRSDGTLYGGIYHRLSV